MALKRFVPIESDLTSADAFKDAVERQFGQRFYDLTKNDFEEREQWEELFREYLEIMYPNNVVEISCSMTMGQADLDFHIIGQKLVIPDTSDPEFFVFPKRRIKPKPLG